MAQGVVEARQADGVKVLIGGACSSTNTRDKLFPDCGAKYDGPFLKWLDFISIHYQPLGADPALVPEWLHRGGEYGPVQVWDTESWVANSEDRVAAVIASMRAQGQNRTAGIFWGNVYTSINRRLKKQEINVVQAWSPAAGVAAVQRFPSDNRGFKQLLFPNGLPWVFVFDGLPKENNAANPDDGTLVIVGDLGGCYDRARTLFRELHGLKNVEKIKAARAALAAAATPKETAKLQAELDAAGNARRWVDYSTMCKGASVYFDFYGNPVSSSSKDGKIVVPLNGLGFFLRTDGSQGSFAKLCDAVRMAAVQGYEPVNVEAHDLTAPIESKPEYALC